MTALKASYDKYLNLNYIQSRSDPEEEPYKTKYEARTLLTKLRADLDKTYAVSDSLSSTFLVSDELRHLKETYEHFYAQIEATCSASFSMTAKSFLISKLLDFNLAKNYIETEEVELGERLVSKIVKDFKLVLSKATTTSDNPADANQDLNYNPLVFNLFLSSLNELVYVWSHRGNYNKCLTLISIIEEIYANYKENSHKNYCLATATENGGGDKFHSYPFDPSELICLNKELSSEKRRSNFEALYTHSLFFMAQIYGKMDEKEKSANYCQLTLQRQMDEHCETVESLENRDPDLITEKDLEQQPQEKVLFNSLEWATHAAAISQYYVIEDDFATARHCLCSAEAVLEVLNNETGTDSYRREKILEQTASIRRCWGKYALELLKVSKLKLLESADLPDQKSLLAERDKVSKFRFNLPSSVYKIEKAELEAITSNIALDFDEARKIFLKAQTILNEAKDYFKLDGFVTDHCEVVRDLSELYGALSFFEPDPDRRAKMQKRRLDLVKPVCDELNEQYYLTLKRQYLFDVGTIYSELMDIKYDVFKDKKDANQLSAKDSAHSVQKISSLAVSSIEYFDKFLDTMKVQPERKVLPEKFDDHNARPALLAKFYIGRLYSKIITLEPEKRLANVKQTSDHYTYLVNYCDKHSPAETDPAANQSPDDDIKLKMKVEYNICKEMITFLPVQMEKLREMIKN